MSLSNTAFQDKAEAEFIQSRNEAEIRLSNCCQALITKSNICTECKKACIEQELKSLEDLFDETRKLKDELFVSLDKAVGRRRI